jgi:hypothetical protein
VAAGTYAEDLVITKPLTLAGAGQGSTTVYPATSGPICSPGSICPGGTNVVLVQASNVLLRDLTIDGDNPALVSGVSVGGADLDARNGIITNHPLGTFNNLEVHHVTVRNIYLRGVYASSGGSFNLHDNVVENVQGEAASIAMFNFGGSGVFAGNTVSGANDAISSNWSTGVQFLNNTITNSASGIHTDNGGTSGSADLIEGNAVSDCTPGGYGIWVFVPYLAHTVNANTVTNCAVGLSAWGQGAAVTPSFTNNTVTGNYEAGGAGAYITTDLIGFGYTDVSVAFSGNIITGNETGVYLTADEQSWNPEPYTAQAITAVFGQNNLAGNTTGVDKGTSGTINADFEHNWWGDASGPSGAGPGTGVSVTTGVDFEPWLCDGTDTSGAPGFQPAASSCGAGPIATDVAANPNPAAVGVASTLTANIDDTTTGGSVITSAEYQVNGGAWQPMAPSDGMFDSVSEDVTVTLSGSPLPDVFTLCVRGTDASGAVGTSACTLLAVYDPSAGFVTGGGWIDSPAGAYAPDPTLTGRANFGFVAKYKKGANVPDGNTEFAFQAGGLNFRSSSYDWLVVNQNATNAQFKGTGTINGTGSYKFMLWATDANPDTFRMKIWSESNGSETIVYDNGTGQALGGGSIIVHKPK